MMDSLRFITARGPRPLSWRSWPGRGGKAMALLMLASLTGVSPASAADGAAKVRGLLRSKAQSDLSVQITAPVAEIPLREGQAFRRGDILLKFNCDLLEAEWKAAQAAYEARRLKAQSKRRLLAYQAAGRLDAAIAGAEATQAKAEARKAQLRVQQCKVRAPYDGWVVARHVDISETPQVGAKLITIVRNGPLEVEMIVPTAWLKWVKPGVAFVFTVDGIGARLRGKVARIGAVADQVSQTIRVFGSVEEPPPLVRAGMTGKVEFVRNGGLSKAGSQSRNAQGGGA